MKITPGRAQDAADSPPATAINWPERYTCPRCDSPQVLHHLIGMPPPELFDNHPAWVVLEGCVGLSPDFSCAACGMGWHLEPEPQDERAPVVSALNREVGAIIVGEQSVLVGRRRAGTPAAGSWEFPGGVIEEGEAPLVALARSLQETLGHEARIGHYASGDAWTDQDDPLTITYYWARLEVPAPTSSPLHDQLRWVPWDQLPELSPWLDVAVAAAHRTHLDLTASPWSL